MKNLDTNRLKSLGKKAQTLTSAQKQAILSNGKILVSAAAGSGKTSTMLNRIILLIGEGVSLKSTLLLVYNESAASELRERLHSQLFDCAMEVQGELRDNFLKALDELPFCHICTIHAFCQLLIRQNFDKLGISPSFEVLDESAHAKYMNKALDATFEEYAKRDDKIFEDICEIFAQARKEENLRNHLKRLYAKIDVQPDREEFFDTVKKCFVTPYTSSVFVDVLIEWYKGYFSKLKARLEEILPIVEVVLQNKYTPRTICYIDLCIRILGSKTLDEMAGIACAFEPCTASVGRGATPEEKDLAEVLNGYFNSAKKGPIEELKSIYADLPFYESAHAQNGEYVQKMLEMTCTFDSILTSLKQEDGVLSFEDLQHKAVELIKQYPLVANEYDAVYVDEYQDVNPTQEFIISHLVKDECFMVGDVKQSIYGFRLADPTIFLSRQQSYLLGEGVSIDFNRNFRSAKGILKFVNGIFNDAMTIQSADVDYKNTASFELDEVKEGGVVELHLFCQGDDASQKNTAQGLYDITSHTPKAQKLTPAVNEGKFIATKIRELVNRAICDGKYIGYGDIAILFRSRSASSQTILDTLVREGIPIDEGAFSDGEQLPERELLCLLKTLDNPRQDIAFAGFLLSFFGGYNESELAEIATHKGDCFYDKFLSVASCDGALSSRVNATLKLLEDYRIKASFKNVSELLLGIVSDFSYDAYLAKYGESYVNQMKSFVYSMGAKDGVSLGRFLDGYESLEKSTKSKNGGDKVHVSTFHGFKGLEIPVVFVADCDSTFNRKDYSGDLLFYGKGYVGMKHFDFDKKIKKKSLSQLAVGKLIKQNAIKEEMRLFYVALTRAKQYMYVTASVSKSRFKTFGKLPSINDVTCDLDFVSNAICNGTLGVIPCLHQTEQSDGSLDKKSAVMGAPSKRISNLIEKALQFEYPFKQATRLAMKYSVSTLDSIDDDTVRVFGDSAKIGTAYHKVMQYIDFGVSTLDEVKLEFERLTCEGLMSEEELSLVNPIDIARCMQSELMSIARECEKQGKVKREQAFMMYKSAREVSDDFDVDDKVLVQGVVDLFIDGNERIIVDFKNSLLKDEDMVKKYKKQLYLYKMAIESAICAKIDKVLLYSFKTGKAIEV